jgi:hypothetical protein
MLERLRFWLIVGAVVVVVAYAARWSRLRQARNEFEQRKFPAAYFDDYYSDPTTMPTDRKLPRR